jgi:hypothetical protein
MQAMRAALALLVLFLVLAAPTLSPPHGLAATPNPADLIVGRWKVVDDGMLIEIVTLGKVYVGSVVLNPKNTTLNGKRLLRELVYDAARASWRGEVFSLTKGKYGPATLRARTFDTILLTGLYGPSGAEVPLKRAP